MFEPIRNKRGDLTVHALKSGYVERQVWRPTSEIQMELTMWWNASEKGYAVGLYRRPLPEVVGPGTLTMVHHTVLSHLYQARDTFRQLRREYN